MRMILLAFALFASASLARAADLETASFDVQNMTCPACGITIEKALGRLDGVTEVRVDADHATVTVEFDPDRATPAAIQEAISAAGFPARPARSDG